MIESAGADLKVTLGICRDVFEGKEVDDSEIYKHDAVYEAIKAQILNNKHSNLHEAILRIMDEDFSGQTILETHHLLTFKLDTEGSTPWTEYSGKYREYGVAAGLTPLMDEGRVPTAMKAMIRQLKADVQATTDNVGIDPIEMAAQYTGCLVAFGMDVEDRNQYSNIAADASLMASSKSEDMDDLPEEFKPKPHKKLVVIGKMSDVQNTEASSARQSTLQPEDLIILRDSYNGLVAFKREAEEKMAKLKAQKTVAEGEATRLSAENKALKIRMPTMADNQSNSEQSSEVMDINDNSMQFVHESRVPMISDEPAGEILLMFK
ncbi:adenosine monophosphate transferase FICD like [Fusarium heterosporum]|uniref:Adenosine monophosphate transferase FICD like n=1 Tax=Fusarium heterosporum TaxID=42747 RepID=A0A8H5WR95_FUSHE|nr:adenosine monophosphate transferase FICD like [Fusarium heterosporum]